MKSWSEGRRLLAVIVAGLAVSLGALAAYRATIEHAGPLAGDWRVTSVSGEALEDVDVTRIGEPLRVSDGGARFKDDINVYGATFHAAGSGNVAVSNTSASLAGRAGPETPQQQAMGLVTQTLFNPGTFHYRIDGDQATVTRDGVTLHLRRA